MADTYSADTSLQQPQSMRADRSEPIVRAPSATSTASIQKKVQQRQEDAYTRVQRLMNEAKAHNKSWRSGSSSFKSSTPRIQPTRKLPTDAMYNVTEKDPKVTAKSGWGISKVPQRLGPKPAVDRFYDAKSTKDITYMHRGPASVPSTPRMPPTTDNGAPPVGRYTSPFISCGMGM